MLDPRERAVITVKDYHEQPQETPYILVYGTHSQWVALQDFTITDHVFYGYPPEPAKAIVFHIDRPWTVFPRSILNIRTLTQYNEDGKVELSVMKEYLKNETELLTLAEGSAAAPNLLEVPERHSPTGQYL